MEQRAEGRLRGKKKTGLEQLVAGHENVVPPGTYIRPWQEWGDLRGWAYVVFLPLQQDDPQPSG